MGSLNKYKGQALAAHSQRNRDAMWLFLGSRWCSVTVVSQDDICWHDHNLNQSFCPFFLRMDKNKNASNTARLKEKFEQVQWWQESLFNIFRAWNKFPFGAFKWSSCHLLLTIHRVRGVCEANRSLPVTPSATGKNNQVRTKREDTWLHFAYFFSLLFLCPSYPVDTWEPILHK